MVAEGNAKYRAKSILVQINPTKASYPEKGSNFDSLRHEKVIRVRKKLKNLHIENLRPEE